MKMETDKKCQLGFGFRVRDRVGIRNRVRNRVNGSTDLRGQGYFDAPWFTEI